MRGRERRGKGEKIPLKTRVWNRLKSPFSKLRYRWVNRDLIREIQAEEDRQEYMPSSLMRLNRFLGSAGWRNISSFLLVVFLFAVLNWLFNSLSGLGSWLSDFYHPGKYMGFRNIFFSFRNVRKAGSTGVLIYILIILFVIIFTVVYRIRMKISFGNLLNKGIVGESRWTTKEEIRRQYPSVAETGEPVSGQGGTIIAHFDGRIYFDNNTVNNLIVGMTRSGKGECYVIPNIDIYSRVEDVRKRPSLIFTDPKKEIVKMSKQILEKRGYETHILDFDDPEKSMGYNPLKIIVDTFKTGNTAMAEQLTHSFSYTLYHNKPATDDYWPDQATVMCNALILAMVQDCLEADQVTNEKRRKAYKEKRSNFDALEESKKKAGIDNYEASLTAVNEKGYSGPDLFLRPDLVYIPTGVPYEDLHTNEDSINIYSLKNIVTELQMQPSASGSKDSDTNALDEFFMSRPVGDLAKLQYASVGGAPQQTKACIYSSFMKGINTIAQANMARMTAENSIDLLDVGYGEKPIAISVVIPDDDKSRWCMATIFVTQLYSVLSRETRKNPEGKTERPVRFILDEFGNLPMFESMGNMLTVCLGKNISFDLYLQNFQQLDSVYGKEGETIKSNCGNQVWILSNDNAGANEFSEKLGKTKRIQVERSGTAFSSNKNITERPVEESLITAYQLMHVRPGETVINRTSKRQDLSGKPIVSHPVFNSYEMGMNLPYRYQYLPEYFPNVKDVDYNAICTESREHIDYLARVWDYEKTQKILGSRRKKYLGQCNEFPEILRNLRMIYGQSSLETMGINAKCTIEAVKTQLKSDSQADPAIVETIFSLMEE